MRRKQQKNEGSSPSSAPETGTAVDTTSDSPDVRRGRPGRRSAEDRRDAVLQLLSGKATVDQLAMRYGVRLALTGSCCAPYMALVLSGEC